METEKIIVRQAVGEDASEIASVHLNSWREAYQGLLPQKFLDQLPLTFRRRKNYWQKTIQYPENSQKVFVAESSTVGVVGFIAVSSGREEKYNQWGEIGAIYLLEAYKQKGIGFQLLSNGFEFLRSKNYKKAYCWVLENNPTFSFYERSGGVRILGEIKVAEIGGEQVNEFAYEWDL